MRVPFPVTVLTDAVAIDGLPNRTFSGSQLVCGLEVLCPV